MINIGLKNSIDITINIRFWLVDDRHNSDTSG